MEHVVQTEADLADVMADPAGEEQPADEPADVQDGQEAGPAKKFCPQCGAEVAPDALFCNKCGAQL